MLSAYIMFNNVFSFSGRIRRMEYGLSYLMFIVFNTVISVFFGYMLESSDRVSVMALSYILYIPLLFCLYSQGAKRCHDINKSGWMQLIPFYFIYLIFKEGDFHLNRYGDSSKEISIETKDAAIRDSYDDVRYRRQ